jgi:hypothetical protein
MSNPLVFETSSVVGGVDVSNWRRLGIAAGLVACASYPMMVFVPLPKQVTLLVASSFGPALAIASLGLAGVLAGRDKSAMLPAAALCNALAGALVTAMLTVQLAIKWSTAPATDPALAHLIKRHLWDVQNGLDVAFDTFIGLGTLFFALRMVRDPRFGKIVGVLGTFIGAVMLIGFNLYAFPDLPKNVGLVDPGPYTGLWYLVATVLMIRWRVSPPSIREGEAR